VRGSLRLGRIAGIEIGVHYTWLLAFVIIVWSLARDFFPYNYPGWGLGTYWIIGTLAALMLFVSVLLHELAHSLVAQARGLPVSSITLFIFGGISNLQEEPKSPGIEFAVAIVGPLTSLMLAGIFWGLGLVLGGKPSPLIAMLDYLALINVILGVFNLLPGFPLDGGRVLRSFLWNSSGNLTRATNTAATIGRFLGWGLIAFGVFELFLGNVLGGLWIAFIGWFLSNAADTSRRQRTLKEHFASTTVRTIMDPNPETVSADTPVAEMVPEFFLQQQRRAVPVSQDGRLVGIVTVTDVNRLPQDKWAETPVAEIMTGQPIYGLSPEDDLDTAMKLITRHDLNQLLVLDQGQPVGLLSRADIIRYLQFSQEMGRKS